MDRNFHDIQRKVFKNEGGFVNRADDPGGPTNLGITLATMRRYLSGKATIADLKKLTIDQANSIYYKQYWAPIMGADLPSGVDAMVYDFGVNSGPRRAVKNLQKVLGFKGKNIDGLMGPMTLKAAAAEDQHDLIDRLADDRLSFMRRLRYKGKSMWATYGRGWTRRVEDMRKYAHALVDKDKTGAVISR